MDYHSGSAVAADHGVLFYAADRLLPPKRPADLVAHLQTIHSFRGVPGVTVGFFMGKTEIATAITDGEGVARAQWLPPGEGDYRIAIRCLKLPDSIGNEERGAIDASAGMLVMVRQPAQKFVVVDLDHTLVKDGFTKVLCRDPACMDDSVAVLTRLAENYGIIYLTARPNALARKSKLWLAEHHYPPGVVLTCGSLRQSIGGGGEYKSLCLATIRVDFPDIQAGVGDQVTDVEAYVQNSITAYQIVSASPGSWQARRLAGTLNKLNKPGQINVVNNWRQIEQGIIEGRRFTVEQFAGKQ